MFQLVVLSLMVSISLGAPSSLLGPIAYHQGQPLTLVEAAPTLAFLENSPQVGLLESQQVLPTSYSVPQSSYVSSGPTSISSQSSTIFHDTRSLQLSSPVPQYAGHITAPEEEIIKAIPSGPQNSGGSSYLPSSYSRQSSTVIHGAKSVVSSPGSQYAAKYASPYAVYAPTLEVVRQAPVFQYAPPVVTSYAAPITVATFDNNAFLDYEKVVPSPIESW